MSVVMTVKRMTARTNVIKHVKVWFQHIQDWFLDAEYDFYKQSVILHAECGFHTHKSNFDMYAYKYDIHECKAHARVWFIHAECNFHTSCNFDTHECDFCTHYCDFFTLSVILIRMRVIITLTSDITTRTNVITTRTSVISTHTWLISRRRVRFIQAECDFTCIVWFLHTRE
jgi:hypothetical protein